MAFPKRLLAEHEKLIVDLRPHWIALMVPVLATVVLVVAEVAAFVLLAPAPWLAWTLVIAGIVAFLAFPVRRFLDWVTSHFVVTSDRLIHRAGWLAKSSMEIPLERVNDVKFRQNVFERVVGAGDLVIESGGEYGQNRFTAIRKPEDVQKLIYVVSEENQNRMLRVGASPPEDDPLDQIEQLARLREQGHISDEEFETQKRRLLGRL